MAGRPSERRAGWDEGLTEQVKWREYPGRSLQRLCLIASTSRLDREMEGAARAAKSPHLLDLRFHKYNFYFASSSHSSQFTIQVISYIFVLTW